MSFLIVETTSKGMIFGADKNVTTIYSDGSQEQVTKTEKVLMWSDNKAMVGFVGQGTIGKLSTTDWIKNFIANNPTYLNLGEISDKLKTEVEKQRRIDEGSGSPQALIIHLGGFEKNEGLSVPKIYMITNVWGLDENGYIDFRKDFKSTEELWGYFPHCKTAQELKTELTRLEQNFDPFWFHQGFDLRTFNTLHSTLKLAFKSLISNHPKHKMPETISEWEKHVKMQILMYGSYFESFHTPTELYVGGGADIISIEWK